MVRSVAMYQAVRDDGATSERLVLAHLPMVRRVAVHLRARIPPFMELDELIQVGCVGLLEAARVFDPDKGVDFENYALSRVRGAILDEVRRLTSMPRSAVAFQREEGQALRRLNSDLGRAPTQAELADFMGTDLAGFQRRRDQVSRFELHDMDSVAEEVMSVPDDPQREPQALLEQTQMIEAATAAIEALPERERLVLSLYYEQGLNLREIGAVLVVTESRVSQLLSGIVRKLRAEVGAAGRPAAGSTPRHP